MTLIHAFDLLPKFAQADGPATEVHDVVALFGGDAALRTWSMK